MRKYLAVDRSRCTGCRLCEFTCSYAHGKTFNPARTRIRVLRSGCLEFSTLVCLHCPSPRCIPACPEGAISKNDGLVQVDEHLCTGCGICCTVCTRIFMNEAARKAVLCDLCEACVGVCPEGALEIRETGAGKR